MGLKYLALFGLLLLCSCEKDVNEGTVWNDPKFIRVKVSSESIKNGDDTHSIFWSRTDKMIVFDTKGKSVELENRDDSPGAIFFSRKWTEGEPNYAVYSSKVSLISEGVYSMNLSNVQEISTLQTYGSNAIASIGKIGGVRNSYKVEPMKNITGFIKIAMSDSTARSIRIESLGDEVLSGQVAVDYSKISQNAESFWTAIEPCNYVEIKALEGSSAATADGCLKRGSYFVSLLPQLYAKGLKITINYADGTNLVRKYATEYGINIPRSELSVYEGTLDDTLLDLIEIKLQFHNEANINPFGDFTTIADQVESGEEYLYNYEYELEGSILTEQLPFVFSKGSSNANYRYAEVAPNGYFFRVNANNGWIKLPGIPGRFLKSVSMTHGNTSAKRFRIQEGDHNAPGKYKSSPNLKADVITSPVTETITFPTGTTVTGEIDATEEGRSYYMQFTSGASLVCYDITLVYAKSL